MDTPVVIHINNTFIDTSSGKDPIVKILDNHKPKPHCLTMVRIVDNCQFCKEPKGNVYSYYVCFVNRYGFLSCSNCRKVAEKAVKDWHENDSYGSANFLRNKTFKVKRSDGTIDNDWTLNKENTLSHFIDTEEFVSCVKSNNTITKFVRIKELIELNKKYDSLEQQLQSLTL